MARRYPVSVLLVELYAPTRFQTYDVAGTEQLLKRHTAQLVELTHEFPALKVIWSHSPTMTARIFEALKRGEAQPGEADCKPIEDGGEVNWNAEEVLRRLPGLGAREVAELRSVRGLTVAQLMNKSLPQLQELLGPHRAQLFHTAITTRFDSK